VRLTKGCLQGILSHVILVHVLKPYFLQAHINIIFHLHLDLPWKSCNFFRIAMHAVGHFYLILLAFAIRLIFGEEYAL
jgi:hypothetical protein